MRDWCRQSLIQADYDERQSAAAAPPPPPPSGPPPPLPPPTRQGFWATVLGDADVQRAVSSAAPMRGRALVSPLMDALASSLDGGRILSNSPVRAAAQARARADIAARRDAALRADPTTARRVAAADAADTRAAQRAQTSQTAAKAADDAEKRAADLAISNPGSTQATNAAARAQRRRDAATRAKDSADRAAQRAATLNSRGGVQSARLASARAGRLSSAASAARTASVVSMVGSGAAGFAVGQAAGTSGLSSGLGSVVGMALGGPVGAVIGAALGTALESIVLGAIRRTVGNVKRSRDSGAAAADGFSRGVLSLTQNALDAGLNIGNTLIAGALRPFGASGSALAGFSSQVGSSIGRALMAGLGAGASGLRLAGGAAGLGVGLAAVLGGSLLLGPLLGPLLGSAVAAGLMKVVSVVAGIIGGVLDKLGQALGEVGRIGGAALKTLIDVLDDLKNTALGLSKSILDLSQNSGMSVGASALAVSNLQGFGITPQQTSQMLGQNVLYTQAQDRGWGIGGDPGSAQNLREFRSVYQNLLKQGDGNPLIANTMATQTGKNALVPMANLPSAMFERSLSNGSGLQMGAGAVLEWQQNFGLMQNDLSRFVEFVKITLGNAFLPAMQRGLGLAVGFFKENKDEIIAGIKSVGRWFYAELPGMVIGGAIFVVQAFSTITKGLANMIRGFSDGKGALNDWIFNFLTGVDRIIHGLRTVIAVSAAVAAAILAPVGTKTVAAYFAYNAAIKATQPMNTNFAGQFQQATQRQYNAQGRPIRTAFDTATDALDAAGAKSDGLLQTLKGWQKQIDPEKLGKSFDGMFQTMQKIEENTGRKQELNANINVQISPQEDFLAKVLSYDQWMTWQTLGQSSA